MHLFPFHFVLPVEQNCHQTIYDYSMIIYTHACHTKRMMLASEPETEFLHIEQTPKEIPGELMKLKHTRQMTEYLKTKSPPPRYYTKKQCFGID